MDEEPQNTSASIPEPPPKLRKRRFPTVFLAASCLISVPFVAVYGLQFFPDLGMAVLDIVGPDIFRACTRAKASRVKADMRTIATALESYYVDSNSYPAERDLQLFAHDLARLHAMGGDDLKTIEPGNSGGVNGLTTPVAYLSKIMNDEFTSIRTDKPIPRFYHDGKFFTHTYKIEPPWPFAYASSNTGTGWIVWSPGPDRHYDIDPEAMYNPSATVPSAKLINATYDPTNGSYSNGDIWRVKQ